MVIDTEKTPSIIWGRLPHKQAYASRLDKRIDELVMEVAQENPRQNALLCPGAKPIRYGELLTGTRQLESTLRQHKLQAGDGVAIYMPKCPDNVLAMLAVWGIGGFVVVLQDSYPTHLLEEILDKTRPKAIICLPDWEDQLPESYRQRVTATTNGEMRLLTLSGGQSAPTRQGLDNLALLMFSTGTTGKPKTIRLSHRCLTYGHFTRAVDYPFEAGEVQAVNVLFVWEIFCPLIFGGTALILTDEQAMDTTGLFNHLMHYKVRRLLTTPSLLQSYLSVANLNWASLTQHLRWWLLCGERVNRRTVSDFHRVLPTVQLINAYGIWECSEISLAELSPATGDTQAVSVGQPCDGVVVAIIDPATQQPVPQGESGEIWVGGASLADGYHDDTPLTEKKFVVGHDALASLSQRWFRTNDLARWRSHDGEIEVIGRLDFMLKIRGFSINTTVVEQAILDLPEASLCAVIPVMNEKTDTPQTLAAYLACDGDFKAAVAKCRQILPQALPHYAIPGFYLPLPKECLTGGDTKKLDRSRLPRRLSLKEAMATAVTGPIDAPVVVGDLRHKVLATFSRHLETEASRLPTSENFFNLGVHSLMVVGIAAELTQTLSTPVQNVDLFEHVTIDQLISHLSRREKSSPAATDTGHSTRRELDIAIIGIAGKFPGAANVDEFWRILRDGLEASTELDEALLRRKGVADNLLSHPDYVKTVYKVDGVDQFDAAFWGIGDKEALRMDPQHRLFLETAYTAIESAGIAPLALSDQQRVGVFATCGIDAYLIHHQQGGGLQQPDDPHALLLTELGSEKDHVAMRLSYLLDLQGPSMAIGCGCASALVAVGMAADAIRAGECDSAIAGASFVSFPQLGYLYDEGLPWSRDGRIRPFERQASGTVLGDCVGVVMLQPLTQARADGNPIRAVLRGVAKGHDGKRKASYAAPSVRGIAHVVEQSLRQADLSASSLSFIEFHGSATTVGDAIEFRGIAEGLSAAGGAPPAGSIAIGSLKGNIGNPNCAGGIAGLIKTTQMLTHQTLVPTMHYRELCPQMSFDGTPFYVNRQRQYWQSTEPRRASINSIGMGGTNCHLILEEYLDTAEAWWQRDSLKWHLLPVSAKTPGSLKDLLHRHADFLKGDHSETPWQPVLLDVACTLQTGRDAFAQRAFAVVQQSENLAQSWQTAADALCAAQTFAAQTSDIVLVFPGQGSQYIGMGKALYSAIPHYRQTVDHCCELLLEEHRLGRDLRIQLWSEGSSDEFEQPTVLQPALFVLEYAMAMLLLEIGIKPVALAGHSIGEITAATVGGWIALADALTLVARRSQATTRDVGEGYMLSVSLDMSVSLEQQTLTELCSDGCDLAAINSPFHQVLSVNKDGIDALEQTLTERGRDFKRLKLNRPFHSRWMEPAASHCLGLAPLQANGNGSRLPVTSNVTGGWLEEALLQSGDYWARQLRQPVRWRENIATLQQRHKSLTWVEAGPGHSLSALIAACSQEPAATIATMCHHASDHPEPQQLLTALGQLWCAGVAINWERFYHCIGSRPRRIPLPGYSFEPTSYWLNPQASSHVNEPVPLDNGADGVDDADDCQVTPRHELPPQPIMPPLVHFGTSRQPPRLRVFCFAWAGGSAQQFTAWAQAAAAGTDIIAVESIGSGSRADETLPESDADDLAELDRIEAAIRSCVHDNSPFALVGLSLGAIVCLELALTRFQDLSGGQLLGVFVCGKEPPPFLLRADDFPGAVTRLENGGNTYNLSDAEWLDYARKMNSGTTTIDPQLFKDFALPRLRSDMRRDIRTKKRVVDWLATHEGLTCTLGVYRGLEDPYFPLHLLADWLRVVAHNSAHGRVLIQQFEGDHAFLFNRSSDILDRLQTDLASLRLPPRPTKTPLYQVRWLAFSGGSTVPAYTVINLADPGLDSLEPPADQTLVILTPCQQAFDLSYEVGTAERFVALIRNIGEASLPARRLVVVLPDDLQGAMVVGLSKAMTHEIPQCDIVRVYVPRAWLAKPESTWLNRVAAFVGAAESDIRLSNDGNSTLVPRLSPVPLSTGRPSTGKPGPHPLLEIAEDEVVLITGGSGALGRALIDWLLSSAVGLRPRQLVLLSRREHASEPGVRVLCTDISSVATLTAEPQLRALRPAALFHLAGDYRSADATHFSVTSDMLRRKLVPKAAILSLLQTAAQLNWNLRTLINFSSEASLLGLAGTAAYSGANALLDHLATFSLPSDPLPPGPSLSRVTSGLAIATLNWGGWEINWEDSGARVARQSAENSERPLSKLEAFAALAMVLQTMPSNPGQSQWLITNIDWQQSKDWRGLPLVRNLVATSPGDGATTTPRQAADQTHSPVLEAESGTEDVVRRFLTRLITGDAHSDASSLHWSQTLPDLGFDSLSLVEVRTHFQKQFRVIVPMSQFLRPNLTLRALCTDLTGIVRKKSDAPTDLSSP